MASSMNKGTIMAELPSMREATRINIQKSAYKRQTYDLGEEAVIFLEPWILPTGVIYSAVQGHLSWLP